MAYDFPASPSTGQVYQGWTYDGEKWLATVATPNTAGVIGIQVFTASGFYVPSPSMTSCVIECWGGGGGGGGALAGTNAFGGGGGGGAGGYSRKMATAAQIGTSQTVTVGATGAAGAAGFNTGGNGGVTSVGILCIANGGAGGGGSNTANGAGGAGGTAGTGDVATTGAPGMSTVGGTGTATVFGTGGAGASSSIGGGAVPYTAYNNSGSGNAATGYAAGGSGAACHNATTSAAGGAGRPGIVVITEYGMTALAAGSSQGNLRYDLPQGLTVNQMAQARANIGDLKKNYIINGAMQVSQENGATALSAISAYPADQFVYTGAGQANPAVAYGQVGAAQGAAITPGGSPNRIRVTVTTPLVSPAAGDVRTIQQAIEGLRFADLKSGTTSAKTITLQFGVKAPAGTYCVAFRNATANRCYIAEYVVAAGETNSDVMKSVSFQLDTLGTWVTDNTQGVYITWCLMSGSTFQTAAGAWTAGNFMASANQFNFMGTNGNVFELFDVGLYEGSVAPPFMVPDYASELALCQRYWENGKSYWGGYASTGVGANAMNFYKAVKRATPTVTPVNAGAPAGFPSTASAIDAATPGPLLGFMATRTASGTGGGLFADTWTANARL